MRSYPRVASACLAAVLILWPSQAHAEDPPRFVYGGAEITRHWNDTHDPNITLHTGRQAAHYLNGLVVHYLRVMEGARLIWHWAGVADCESGGNPSTNTGNGYYGAYQFTLSTWHSVGGSGYPHRASLLEQTRRAEILRQRVGLGQWPVCGGRYR